VLPQWATRSISRKPGCSSSHIEVHHVIPENKKGKNDLDNAISLCFDCDSEIMHYNNEHPRGTKYRSGELKTRRDQVYEEFTRHLVPPIIGEVTQSVPGGLTRKFPDIGFLLTHYGNSLPVQVRVIVESIIGERGILIPSEYYSGKKLWHLNPHFSFPGHFTMPKSLIPKTGSLELKVKLGIIDQFEREHPYLPVSFIYVPDGNYWYAEP
jgi:hypothetical protein